MFIRGSQGPQIGANRDLQRRKRDPVAQQAENETVVGRPNKQLFWRRTESEATHVAG